MIGFRNFGRCGNYLFEAAACIALALRNGIEFSMPNFTRDNYGSPLYLQHLVNPKYQQGLEDILINEQHFHYAPIEYKKEWDDKQVVLNGYWQSEKHFIDFKDRIIELFNFPYSEIKDTCSVHARFRDYFVVKGKHITVDKDYLNNAIEFINEKTGIEKFKVFSDDLKYFKNNFGNLYDFEYSTNNNVEKDLIEISCCACNINSSSTFSWWSSYLNRNPRKIIVTQEKWFKDGWQNADVKDILPESWIKL